MPRPSDTQTIFWEAGAVRMIDQRCLPDRFEVLTLTRVDQVAEAIRTMAVRGAPAIGVTAALGLALEANRPDPAPVMDRLREAGRQLAATRPTAVNLFWAIRHVLTFAEEQAQHGSTDAQLSAAILELALRMHAADIACNRAMGSHGAELLPDGGNILTHCNTGSLAAVYHGTALGVIRSAVETGKRLHVWVDETRPRQQGMKLTAWECRELGIPATVITDGMAAWLMAQGRVDAVIVGADRIASNGDTANKIGTYHAAVAAQFHGVPFYVAAPLSTVDFDLPDGSGIPIEERDPREVTHVGDVRVAPEGVEVYNPAFDVTPHRLVTAIITEFGVARAPLGDCLNAWRKEPTRHASSG